MAAPRRHLHAVDLMRVLTVVLVVGVHTVSNVPVKDTVAAGALTVIFHSSREIFFVVTALVLMYGYGRRPVRWAGFWRRRYLCVAVPYVAWTLVYMLADGHWRDPLASFLSTLAGDLATGGAKYQLYFLLVSMQIYLCFPAIRWLIRATRNHHGVLLGACAAVQLVLSAAIHAQWSPGGLITAWMHGPDAVLPSYLLYVVAGGVAAWHFDAIRAWTLAHRRLVLGGTVTSIAAAVAAFLVQRLVLGETTADASGVFQPVVVVDSLAIAWTFFTAGVSWVERGMPLRRVVLALSDSSFGIYLAHPLVLMGMTRIAGPLGLLSASTRAPLGLVLPIVVVVVVPLVYVIAALPALLLRRTPLSLAMSGRPQRRPVATVPTLAAREAVAA
ncbi:MAG TPA: acyltransferase [Candidatus Dormibacteraeota bacterium]